MVLPFPSALFFQCILTRLTLPSSSPVQTSIYIMSSLILSPSFPLPPICSWSLFQLLLSLFSSDPYLPPLLFSPLFSIPFCILISLTSLIQLLLPLLTSGLALLCLFFLTLSASFRISCCLIILSILLSYLAAASISYIALSSLLPFITPD